MLTQQASQKVLATVKVTSLKPGGRGKAVVLADKKLLPGFLLCLYNYLIDNNVVLLISSVFIIRNNQCLYKLIKLTIIIIINDLKLCKKTFVCDFSNLSIECHVL